MDVLKTPPRRGGTEEGVVAMRRVVELQEAALGGAKAGGDEEMGKAYEKVLRAWREEVYALLVREASREKREMVLLTEKEKLAGESALRERAEFLAQRAIESKDLAEARAKNSTAEAGEARALVHTLKEEHDKLWDLARSAKALADDSFRSKARLSVASARQEEHCARLERAGARLGVLHTLLDQRETRMRNAAAALAAERRLWQRERRKAEMQALNELLPEAVPSKHLMIGRGLQPQAEALMRGVFVALDEGGTGRVSVNALATALRHDTNLEALMHHYIGATAWTKALEELEYHLLRHRRHVHDEGPVPKTDLAWGEFLLLFVPTIQEEAPKHDDATTCISIAPALLAAKPILTLEPRTPHSSTPKGINEALGVDALRRELSRLSRDRSALIAELTRVRDWTLRAAEDASLNWRNELRAMELRAERAERSSALEMKLKQEALNRIDALDALSAANAASFSSLTKSASAESTRALAAKQRLIESLTSERDAAISNAKIETERLESALAESRQERDKAIATTKAIEKEVTILRDQIEALEAQLSLRQSAEAQSEEAKSQLTAVTHHRDSLLRLLQEQRSALHDNHRSAIPHSSQSYNQHRATSSSNNNNNNNNSNGSSSHLRALANLQALTDDLLLDDSDDNEDDDALLFEASHVKTSNGR